jgi:hypothetical protein
MNQKINGCFVFFPQRVLSVESKEVSGVYLGTKEVSTLKVRSGFDKIMDAQSDSKLASNNQDNPLVVVFQNNDNSTFVIFDKSKKLLFCHSFLDNENVYIIKAALRKEFTSDSMDDFFEYANSHLGKAAQSSELIELDIDGNTSLVDSISHLSNIGNFFCASITPLLRFSHNINVAISNRGYSMVILDVQKKLLCVDCMAVDDVIIEVVKGTVSVTNNPAKNGLEGYFNKVKKNT